MNYSQLFQRQYLENHAVFFVFEPLNVIIQQQLSKLGLYATCLKEKNDAAVLDKLKMGDYTYIYTHPEHMIGKNPYMTV